MNRFSSIRHGARRGFTMVEIILVVVIIMTLAAVVGPRLTGQARQNRERITKVQMDSLKSSLQQFEVQMSRFPTTQEGIGALLARPNSIDEADWPGKLVDSMPKDGFGTEFRYVCPSENGMDYDLISAGADKKFNTEDDITNFDNKSSGEQNL